MEEEKILREIINKMIEELIKVDVNTLSQSKRRDYYNLLKQGAIMNFREGILDEIFEKDLNEHQNKEIMSILAQTEKIIKDIMFYGGEIRWIYG